MNPTNGPKISSLLRTPEDMLQVAEREQAVGRDFSEDMVIKADALIADPANVGVL